MPLASIADVERRLGECVDDAALAGSLLDEASSLARAIACSPISLATYVAEAHDGRGIRRLRPHRALIPTEGIDPALVVSEVRVSGSVVDPDTYVVKPEAGTVHRRNSAWPCGVHNVEVDYDAGFDPVPDWIVGLVAGAVARVIGIPTASMGIESESWGDQSIAFASAGTGSTGRVPGFTRTEEARLAALKVRLPGFA